MSRQVRRALERASQKASKRFEMLEENPGGNGEGELNEKMIKGFTDVLDEKLPGVVDQVLEKKLEELKSSAFADIADIKTALKELSFNQKNTPEAKDFMRKAAMVAIVKDVWKNKVNTEAQFKEVVEAHTKTMGEGDALEGAEFVFDQFEKDVAKVINTFELVNYVKVLGIVKGDKVNIPKVTNGITTAFVAENGTPTASEPVTGFVTIDIYKAVTLTNFSEELIDDCMTVPDLYDLLVELIGESQGEFLENQILNGTGSSQVEGILVGANTNVVQLAATKRASDISDTNLVTVMTTAAQKYKRNAQNIKRVMSQYVYGKLLQIRTTDGAPLYPELRPVSFGVGVTRSLLGYGVIISDKMPCQDAAADIAGVITILFGDLRYFTLVRRKGLTNERGYYGNNWRDGIQSLKSTARFGGKMTFPPAFTVLKNGAT